MRKKSMKRFQLICHAYFKRNSAHRGSVERAELNCHTASVSQLDGILTSKEWIDIARKANVRAIAITDFQDIEGFREAAQAVEKLRRETGELNFKVLYGLETVLEDGGYVHFLVQRQEGLAQLYRLLEIAWQNREKWPFLRKSEINEHRTGLLVGCPGKNGEIYRGILKNLDDACLEEIAGFYDYLSILTPQQYKLLFKKDRTPRSEVLGAEDLIRKTIFIGKRSGKPVAATGNMRTANQDWNRFKSSTAYDILKNEDLILKPTVLRKQLGKLEAAAENIPTNNQSWGLFKCGTAYCIVKGEDLYIPLPDPLYTKTDGAWDISLPDLLDTEEMLSSFSFLEKELAEEIVIHIPNRLADLCEGIQVFPRSKRCLQPILPDAFQTIAGLCQEQLQIRYDGAIPETVRERIEHEFTILQSNELLCSFLLIGRHLVQGLQEKGYPVRASFRSHASVHTYSYAACLLGVTEIDPFVMHIPCEAYIRELDAPDLVFTLSVPQECLRECWEESAEIFSQIFPQGMLLSYMKKGSRTHKRILIPDTDELRNWTPLKSIDGGYMIPYEDIEDFPQLIQMDLWPAYDLNLLRRLEQSTGVLQSSVNIEEAVPLLLRDQTDIPGFKNPEVQTIWEQVAPKTMDDIIKVFALSNFRTMGAWAGNGEKLVQQGSVPFSEVVGSTEDVFCRLLDAGLGRTFIYQFVESLRGQRHSEMDEKFISVLTQNGIPEWFINSCKKIEDLNSKAREATRYAIPALKTAWYKTHFPIQYKKAYSECHAE